jgi:hypothetical protein
MTVSGDVTFTAMTAFESNMRLELNQQKSALADTCIKRDVAGAEKTKIDNLISNHTMRKKTERNGDVTHDQTGYDGIWVVKPDPDYLATLVDKEDTLMTRVDLQGADVMAHAGAYQRARDAGFLQGFFGDMITGKSGTVLNAFPSANAIAVTYDGAGGAVALGLTVRKIRHARKILAGNFVNLQQKIYLAVDSTSVEQITSDAQVQNSDFLNAMKPRWSEDGKFLLGLAGFEFVDIELGNPLLWSEYGAVDLTDAGSTQRDLPFWTADGMVEATWEDLFTSVDKLPTKHFSAQVYSRQQRVYSRTDQARCGKIRVQQ